MRQQFAIDLLDQADAESVDEPVEEGGDHSGAEAEDDAADAAEDEADAAEDEADPPSDELELEGAVFAAPNDESGVSRVAAGGPHLET